MMTKPIEEQKKAITCNDKCYDDQFFYAVKTTKIFCRPSCKSRVPNFDNVSIVLTAEDAIKAGYRPCKRCKSGGGRLPDEEWVAHVELYIKENYIKTLTLDLIAENCHGSAYHLHRVFKSIKGITPLEYLQQIRMKKAKRYLMCTDLPIQKISKLVGITNASRFSTLFKEKNKQTPREFRKNLKRRCQKMKTEQKQAIYYGKIKDKSGSIYVAATDKGLCFVGSLNEGINELKKWIDKKRSDATLIENEVKISPYASELADYLNGKRRNFNIPIDLKGTPFQEAIWNELQTIPYGETVSYSDIAHHIGKPNAVRAVGAAIGANPVLIAVPCHRVVAKNGSLTGFRGGIPMKEKLLTLEKNERI